MYLVKFIAGDYYWQTVEKLPRKLRNAVEGRWERSRFIVRALLGLAIIGGAVWVSDGGGTKQSLLWGLSLIFSTFFCLGGHINLTWRHRATIKDLQTGFNWSGYLVSERNLLYSSIMAPGLKAYLVKDGLRLPEEVVLTFATYHQQAHSVIDKTQGQIRKASALEKIKLTRRCERALNRIAEAFARLAIEEIKDIDLGNFFREQRLFINKKYMDSLVELIEEDRTASDRLLDEMTRAQDAYVMA